MMESFPRPLPGEYADYYAGYIAKAPEGGLLEVLRNQQVEFTANLRALSESQGEHRYASDKWSVKEVIAHLIDAERVFAYRALRIARGDQNPLPGFDEVAYARESLAGGRTLADLIEEFEYLRLSNIAMFSSLPVAVAARLGTASGYRCSVRALAWIIAGHVEHHRRLLVERYGVWAG